MFTLRGGPMNGWTVKADAPVLREGWSDTWPPTIAGGRSVRALHRIGIHAACRWHRGVYVVNGAEAHWEGTT